jgi:hypothetical protein
VNLVVIVVPALLVLLFVVLEARQRRLPFPSAMVPGMRCPFCGHEMRPGRILHGGYPLWWQPSAWPRRRFLAFDPGGSRSRGEKAVFDKTYGTAQVRGASICDACEAVVIDPKAAHDA